MEDAYACIYELEILYEEESKLIGEDPIERGWERTNQYIRSDLELPIKRYLPSETILG